MLYQFKKHFQLANWSWISMALGNFQMFFFFTKTRVSWTQPSCVSDKWYHQWLFVLPLFILIVSQGEFVSSVSKYLLDLLKRTLSTPGLKKTPQIDLVYTCNTKNQNIARSVQSYLLILYTQEYFAWLLEIS